MRWLCGTGQLAATGSACQLFGSIDPSDLNQPNIAIGALAGKQTVTRTVTNVSKRVGVYVPVINKPAGVDVTVSPRSLRVKPGAKATYQVTFTRTRAAFGTYAFGALTWTDGSHRVRSQLVVNPVPAAAPASISGTGTSGSRAITVTPGFTGTLTTAVDGLVAADVRTPTLSPTGAGFDPDAPAVSARSAKESVTIPAGTTVARHSTFDADFAAGTDVDLYLYEAGTSNLVASSGGGSAEETILIQDPPAGTYDLYVVLFGGRPRPDLGYGPHVPVEPGRDGQGQPDRDAGQPGRHRGHAGHGHRDVERADRGHAVLRPDQLRRRQHRRRRHVRPDRQLAARH